MDLSSMDEKDRAIDRLIDEKGELHKEILKLKKNLRLKELEVEKKIITSQYHKRMNDIEKEISRIQL